jgi:hypothetical protein
MNNRQGISKAHEHREKEENQLQTEEVRKE